MWAREGLLFPIHLVHHDHWPCVSARPEKVCRLRLRIAVAVEPGISSGLECLLVGSGSLHIPVSRSAARRHVLTALLLLPSPVVWTVSAGVASTTEPDALLSAGVAHVGLEQKEVSMRV